MLNILNKVTEAIAANDRVELAYLSEMIELRILSAEEYQALDALINAGLKAVSRPTVS